MTADEQEQSIDWARLRRRLDRAQEALGRGGQKSDERQRQIMEERRRRLARRPDQAQAAETLSVLRFWVGGQAYALPLSQVFGVSGVPPVTALPDAGAAVVGVGLVRGSIFKLVALSKLLAADASATEPRHVILVGDQRAQVGVLADRVDSVDDIDLDGLREPADGGDGNLIRGIAEQSTYLLRPGPIIAG